MEFEYAVIPTGVYRIGDEKIPVSRPPHEVMLAAFGVGLTAVTNGQFAGFVAGGGYQDVSLWTVMGWRWLQSRPVTEPAYWQDAAFNHPFQPVVGVSWYEALAFSRWLKRETGQGWRLLTEVEWETAAGHIPPDDPQRINTIERGIGRTWSAFGVGNQAACSAWNLCGNGWEWTSSQWGRNWQTLGYHYPYDARDGREDLEGSAARVMRGGSYFDPLSEAHPANRGRFLPGSRASNIGFRLGLSL